MILLSLATPEIHCKTSSEQLYESCITNQFREDKSNGCLRKTGRAIKYRLQRHRVCGYIPVSWKLHVEHWRCERQHMCKDRKSLSYILATMQRMKMQQYLQEHKAAPIHIRQLTYCHLCWRNLDICGQDQAHVGCVQQEMSTNYPGNLVEISRDQRRLINRQQN